MDVYVECFFDGHGLCLVLLVEGGVGTGQQYRAPQEQNQLK